MCVFMTNKADPVVFMLSMCSGLTQRTLGVHVVYVFRTNTADPVVFTLTPPECFMEIRNGYGTTGQ